MKSMKFALALAAAIGTVAAIGGDAMANDHGHKDSKHEAVKEATSTPGDVKTSNDDSGMNPEAAPHDKAHHAEGNATPGDVKTSNDDSGMNNDVVPNDKVGTIPGESTPGDVKTSNDDSGMNPEEAPHDKVKTSKTK